MIFAFHEFMMSALHVLEAAMSKKSVLKIAPVVPRPLTAMLAEHRTGTTKPLQIRIDPQLHCEIKLAATEQGKSMTGFLLECYHFWRSMNK